MLAEYVVFHEEEVVKIPAGLTAAEAAPLPVAPSPHGTRSSDGARSDRVTVC